MHSEEQKAGLKQENRKDLPEVPIILARRQIEAKTDILTRIAGIVINSITITTSQTGEINNVEIMAEMFITTTTTIMDMDMDLNRHMFFIMDSIIRDM